MNQQPQKEENRTFELCDFLYKLQFRSIPAVVTVAWSTFKARVRIALTTHPVKGGSAYLLGIILKSLTAQR